LAIVRNICVLQPVAISNTASASLGRCCPSRLYPQVLNRSPSIQVPTLCSPQILLKSARTAARPFLLISSADSKGDGGSSAAASCFEAAPSARRTVSESSAAACESFLTCPSPFARLGARAHSRHLDQRFRERNGAGKSAIPGHSLQAQVPSHMTSKVEVRSTCCPDKVTRSKPWFRTMVLFGLTSMETCRSRGTTWQSLLMVCIRSRS
jgi:hypothetical protein